MTVTVPGVDMSFIQKGDPGGTPLVERVVASVSDSHGVAAADIRGRRRFAPYARARHEVWTILRLDYGWSWPAIAREFQVDHSTVITAVRKVAARRSAPRLVRVVA